MRISTKGRYALRLMLDIAMSEGYCQTAGSVWEVSGTDCFGADQGRIFKKYSWPPGWISSHKASG